MFMFVCTNMSLLMSMFMMIVFMFKYMLFNLMFNLFFFFNNRWVNYLFFNGLILYSFLYSLFRNIFNIFVLENLRNIFCNVFYSIIISDFFFFWYIFCFHNCFVFDNSFFVWNVLNSRFSFYVFSFFLYLGCRNIM